MKYDVLYNFISPVTGRIKVDQGYIVVGDKDNIGMPSPILIDIRQDIIDLRRKIGGFEELNKLDHNRIWIGDYNNEPVEQLHIGIINLPRLEEAVFPNPISPIIGDFRIPNPTFDYISAFDWVMSGPFLPQIYATKYDTFGNPIGTDVSSSLAMTQVRAAQIMKRFDNANFIVGSSTVDFTWENPKMYLIPEALKQLYGLGTTYTFTKAQSLGALETGLLKNTVNNGTGTLSKAISGEDYVNTADIPIGNLVILDPSYPLSGHKLIAPISFSIRGNTANEFGYPVANTIDVLTGEASKFEKLAITSIENNALIKSNDGELVKATPNTDYVTPSVIIDILATLSATESVVKNIIGVEATVNIKDVTGSQATALTTAVKNVVGLAETVQIGELSAEAADLVTNKSALLEIEAQIAALAGVVAISDLIGIFSVGYLAISGYNYGQYIKGQSLNTKNTWYATDLNDDASNATGELRPLQITPYQNENRGYGTLWFDSNDRDNAFQDKKNAEPGLRIFSWDSSPIGFRDSLAPIHIGLFGYRKNYTEPDEYKGFIFRSEFSDSGDDYRFPVNFGLYKVYKKLSSYISGMKYGWESRDVIFEYDYSNFTFYTPVVLQKHTNFNKGVDFQGDVRFLGTGSLTIPVGPGSQQPSSPLFGMIRANSDTNSLEYYTSSSWATLNSSNATVSSVNITGSTGLSISGSPITTSGTITLTLSDGLQNLSSLSSTSTANQILLSGSLTTPSWSTATYPVTTTINQLLYSSANNTLAGLATANNGILITNSSGVPSISSTLPSAVQGNITATGIVTAGTWNGTTISVAYGGTGLSSTTAYGVLCGGTTSTGNLQNVGTASIGYFLGGTGSSSLPSWKTAVTSVNISGSTGLSVSGSPITGNGTITISLNNELMGVSQLSSLGMIVRRTGSIYSTVQLTTASAGLSFTNPDGVASNPQINLNAELQGVAVLSSVGLIARTASGVYTARTITAGDSSITVNNGNGVTANPSITIGTVPIANLANYPSSSTQFLRGNGSWSQPTLNDIGSPTSGSTFNFNSGKIINLGATTTVDTFTANAPIISNTAFTSNGPTTINYGLLDITSTGTAIDWATWFAYFKMQQTGISTPPIAVSGTYNLGGLPRSIKCAGAISATEFESTSSIKKKNIISNYEDFKEELKEKFDTIDFVKYEWKDKLKEGFGEYYGYIAENVSKAFPELVNLKHTEYAPNILKYADLSYVLGKNYRIIFSEDMEIDISKKLKIISKDEKTFEAILTMKENNNSYLLSFLTDAPPVGEIFVYGSYEEVPQVSKTRFHDMSAARLKILIDEVALLSKRISLLENNYS